VEIKESRLSRSRPGIGFVRYEAVLTNQEGEPVFVTTSTLMVKARLAAR
jgi:acyl dehydratase